MTVLLSVDELWFGVTFIALVLGVLVRWKTLRHHFWHNSWERS